MTTPQALLIGAVAIAVSIFLVDGMHNAAAQAEYYGGRFQLMHHSNTVANAGVFKIDTSNGEVSYCYISADQNLTCSRPVK